MLVRVWLFVSAGARDTTPTKRWLRTQTPQKIVPSCVSGPLGLQWWLSESPNVKAHKYWKIAKVNSSVYSREKCGLRITKRCGQTRRKEQRSRRPRNRARLSSSSDQNPFPPMVPTLLGKWISMGLHWAVRPFRTASPYHAKAPRRRIIVAEGIYSQKKIRDDHPLDRFSNVI